MDDSNEVREISYTNTEGVFEEDNDMNLIDGVELFDTTLYMNECWRRLNAAGLLHKFLAVVRYCGKNNMTPDVTTKQILKSFPGMFRQEEFNTYVLIELMHDYPIVAEAYGYDLLISKELEVDAVQHHALNLALKSEVMQDLVDYKTNWIDNEGAANVDTSKPRFAFRLGGK